MEDAIEILKPESRTDHLTIKEIFKKDIYRTKQLVEKGEVWIDIGANIGAFALKCLELGVSKIVCYEPDERNFNKIKNNIVDERLELNKCAVSNFNGKSLLYIEKNGNWRHTIMRKIRGREAVEVDVLDVNKIQMCDGMKLDCEGSEVSILKHLSYFPNKLVLEYDGAYHKKLDDFNAFIDFLKTK